MELRRYAGVVVRWSWLLALGTFLGALAAFLVSRGQTPLYQAEATILVNQAQGITGPSYTDILANQQLSKTYAQLAATPPVLQQVAQNLGVDFAATGTTVSADLRRDTQLINVTATSTDPELAARVANETVRVFGDKITADQLGPRAKALADRQEVVSRDQKALEDRQAAVTRLQGKPPGLPEDQRLQQLSDAQAALETARQNLAASQRAVQDLNLELARTVNSVALASPAERPLHPVSPRVFRTTALGAIVGLLLVAGIVGVIEYLDDTVKSPDDVTRAAGAATIGAIRRFSGADGPKGSHLLTSLGPNSPVSEAYRVVRTNLEFARAGKAGKTMLITSATPGEGKSTTAANLALVLAQTGRSVLLVDADLRRPTQHKLFDLPNGAGLSTLFVMETPAVETFLRASPVENLMVLPSGPLPPNPAELLVGERMGEILNALTAIADVVLIDSPPLLGVADSSVLAARVDGVVLVLDASRTRAGALQQSVESLRRASATLWGVVLNKLPNRRVGDGYASYYYAGYGYSADSSPSDSRRNGHAAGGVGGTAVNGKGAAIVPVEREERSSVRRD